MANLDNAIDPSERQPVSRPVVFLDKDGTLIKDLPYNVNPDLIVLEEGAALGLRQLVKAGFKFVVVTNQSGVAHGYFQETALEGVKQRLNWLLMQSAGASLSGFYYCPHHPQGVVPGYNIACDCRKPHPGMLLRAAEELKIDLSQSWMAGDVLNDIEAGNRAGCRTILINNGHETEWQMGPFRIPDFIASDLNEAAGIILAHTEWNATPLKPLWHSTPNP